MNERERLIELIYDGSCSFLSTEKCKNLICEYRNCCEEVLVDYLLANGVIVPPVKVGDTVYGISRGAIIPITVGKISYSNNGMDIIGRNEQYFGRSLIHIDPDNEFGIEWYTTKEQAEKALKEGERNE